MRCLHWLRWRCRSRRVLMLLVVITFTFMMLVIYNRMLFAMITVGGYPKLHPPWIALLLTDMSDDGKVAETSGKLLTPKDPGYLSMCLTVKDEHMDIIENIEYHRKVGVSKIYVIDTGSNPPLKSLLLPYIMSGLVVYSYVQFPWHNILSVFMATPSPQELTQNMCLHWWGPRHKFMAFTDVDEFIVVTSNVIHRTKLMSSSNISNSSSHRSRKTENSIRGYSRNNNNSSSSSSSLQPQTRKHLPHHVFAPAALEPYEQFGGLALNWMVFGSSGLVSRPNGTVLSSYTKCAPSITIKSIVVPEHTLSASPNPHWFHYKDGYHAVNERGDKVDTWLNDPPTMKHLYINHYATKSLEDFHRKMKRGSATRAHKKISEFERFNAMATDTCTPPTLLMAS